MRSFVSFVSFGIKASCTQRNHSCSLELAIELRERYCGVESAYHMNKRLWNGLYLERDLDDATIKHWIKHSYDEVVKKLPKKFRSQYE